jgi:hypothetical protein
VQEFVEGQDGMMVPADSEEDDNEEEQEQTYEPERTYEPDTYDPFAR